MVGCRLLLCRMRGLSFLGLDGDLGMKITSFRTVWEIFGGCMVLASACHKYSSAGET